MVFKVTFSVPERLKISTFQLKNGIKHKTKQQWNLLSKYAKISLKVCSCFAKTSKEKLLGLFFEQI